MNLGAARHGDGSFSGGARSDAMARSLGLAINQTVVVRRNPATAPTHGCWESHGDGGSQGTPLPRNVSDKARRGRMHSARQVLRAWDAFVTALHRHNPSWNGKSQGHHYRCQESVADITQTASKGGG